MNANGQRPVHKSQLSREELAVYVAARYALALMQAALMAAVQCTDDLGGLQAGDVRVDGRLPRAAIEGLWDGEYAR